MPKSTKYHQNHAKFYQNHTIGGVIAKCFGKCVIFGQMFDTFDQMFWKLTRKWVFLAHFGLFLFIFSLFLGIICIYGGLGRVFSENWLQFLQIWPIWAHFGHKSPQNS